MDFISFLLCYFLSEICFLRPEEEKNCSNTFYHFSFYMFCMVKQFCNIQSTNSTFFSMTAAKICSAPVPFLCLLINMENIFTKAMTSRRSNSSGNVALKFCKFEVVHLKDEWYSGAEDWPVLCTKWQVI